MFDKIRHLIKRKPSLEKRIKDIEILLEGEDTEPDSSNWSYKDIRQILDKTDLIPNMSNQELQNIAPSYERIEAILEEVKETDAHTGPQTLKYRLEMIEGCLSILNMSHIGHTNYSEVEFRGMHGYNPSQTDEDLRQQVDGMQKKLDRITKLLENAEFKITGKEALKL